MARQTRLLFDQLKSYQQAGQWTNALVLCDQLYKEAWRRRDLSELTDIVIKTGYIHNSLGDTAAAVDNFQLAAVIAGLSGAADQAARSLNGSGIVHQRLGDLDTADRLYHEALLQAEISGDRRIRGDVLTNIGINANIRGDLEEALASYRAAYDQYEEGLEKGRIARVLNNIGMLQIDLHQYDEAEQSLERALNIARSINDLPTEGIILTNQAELFFAQSNLVAARSACDLGFEIANRLEDDSLITEMLKFYGMIARENSQTHLSELYLKQGEKLARDISYKLGQAEVARELSILYLRADRSRDALQHFIEAHNLFSSLKAESDTADVTSKLTQLENDFMSFVIGWGESIEAKDRYTSGHCKRVAYYACEMAREIGLSALEMNWFRMGAFLHDVGKTETPEEILNKPGKLTVEERKIIERHTVDGDKLLSSMEFPWDIRPMVRSHHERWDGNGYPDGLAADNIPLAARILKIADVFDALTTSRSYREPMPFERALSIMKEDEGAFDPELFGVFLLLAPAWEEMDSSFESDFSLS